MAVVSGQSVRSEESIRVQTLESCFLCNSEAILLYQGLRDRILDTLGEWNLMKCSNAECGLLWLDPMPLEKEVNKFYENYHAGQEELPMPQTRLRRTYRLMKKGYL
jgi:hypothetical protein